LDDWEKGRKLSGNERFPTRGGLLPREIGGLPPSLLRKDISEDIEYLSKGPLKRGNSTQKKVYLLLRGTVGLSEQRTFLILMTRRNQ